MLFNALKVPITLKLLFFPHLNYMQHFQCVICIFYKDMFLVLGFFGYLALKSRTEIEV